LGLVRSANPIAPAARIYASNDPPILDNDRGRVLSCEVLRILETKINLLPTLTRHRLTFRADSLDAQRHLRGDAAPRYGDLHRA
jgi:hypothetical protein